MCRRHSQQQHLPSGHSSSNSNTNQYAHCPIIQCFFRTFQMFFMALSFLSLLPSPIHSFPTTTNSLLNPPIPLAHQQQQYSNWTFPPAPLQSSAHQNIVALGEEAEEPHPIFDINGQSPEEEHRPSHFEILSFDWHHVETPYTVSTWILLASIAKILFHVHKEFGEAIPDSALLVVVGLILGYALQQLHVSYELFTLKSSTFFLYLLPPIIFDAGYFMPNRQLFENLDSVMLFAIVGTIWNTLAIGLSLFVLGKFQLFSVPFSPFEILLFASLISAVDPVAVIAVFEEIHVNEFLFINVFGEALFNDGVSVVLYQMFRKFTLIGYVNLALVDYLSGAASFLVIALGGTLIGIGFAFVVSLLTRFTSRVKILAPVFVFVVPYLAYLTAELFGMSAILSIVACGIMMRQYVKGNLSHDANQSVKYFIKMLAQCSETAIFMFLGLSTISSKHHWDTPFVCITIGLCLLYRTIGVIVQCAILNRFRSKKFSFRDQFVLCYGGLRGAIAFGLVVSLPAVIPAKRMFVTTCIAVIYFTVFLMGITIRPLLFLLKVEKADLDYEAQMVEKVYNKYFDYTMAGIEDIIGQRGRHFIRDTFERLNAKLLKPLLMRNVKRKPFDATDIVRAYNKITLHEALKIAQIGRKMTKESAKPYGQSIASAYREAMNGGTPIGCERTGSTKKDIDQYLANEENSEVLYGMFSRLLDRKIDELQRIQARQSKIQAEDDIKDNYMDILNTTSQQQDNGEQQRKMTSPASIAAIHFSPQQQNSMGNGGHGHPHLHHSQQQHKIQSKAQQRRRRSQPELMAMTTTTTTMAQKGANANKEEKEKEADGEGGSSSRIPKPRGGTKPRDAGEEEVEGIKAAETNNDGKGGGGGNGQILFDIILEDEEAKAETATKGRKGEKVEGDKDEEEGKKKEENR